MQGISAVSTGCAGARNVRRNADVKPAGRGRLGGLITVGAGRTRPGRSDPVVTTKRNSQVRLRRYPTGRQIVAAPPESCATLGAGGGGWAGRRSEVGHLRRDPRASLHVQGGNVRTFAVAEGEAGVSEITTVPGDAVGRELLGMIPQAARPENEDAFLEQSIAERRVGIRWKVNRGSTGGVRL